MPAKIGNAKIGVMLHLRHVSGEHMKAQGSDGLSRRNLKVGVMTGTAMLDFVPTHLNAFERSAMLLPWIKAWTGSDELELLSPAKWFNRGHDLQSDKWEFNVDGLKMPTIKSGFVCLVACTSCCRNCNRRVAKGET